MVLNCLKSRLKNQYNVDALLEMLINAMVHIVLYESLDSDEGLR
jgi:hypothetical protein